MKKWELFEKDCAFYLNTKYQTSNCLFIVAGGTDSTSNDIQVVNNGKIFFNIECKMSKAQCGQFVLFTDMVQKRFIFSERNKTPYNKFAKQIIDEMERNFDICMSAGTNDIPISESTIIDWVKDYYLRYKKSKFCITKHNDIFLIFPIRNIEKYFSFSAKYRVKRSGSSNPAYKDKPELEQILSQADIYTTVYFDKSVAYADFSYPKEKFILYGTKYRFQFSKEGNKYRIRKLSNTQHSNFIVSIRLKATSQNNSDLNEFEAELIK